MVYGVKDATIHVQSIVEVAGGKAVGVLPVASEPESLISKPFLWETYRIKKS